jgi:hypothetical protein
MARDIFNSLRFGNPLFDAPTQFDHVVVLGDLNYRVIMPYDDVLKLIKASQLTPLREADQVRP